MKTKEEQFNDIYTRVCTAIENQAGSEDTFKSADVATSHAKQLEKQNHALIFKEKASDAFESASFHFPYEIEHIGDDLSKYESLSAEQIDAEVKYLQEKISYLKARKAFIAAWTVRDMFVLKFFELKRNEIVWIKTQRFFILVYVKHSFKEELEPTTNNNQQHFLLTI